MNGISRANHEGAMYGADSGSIASAGVLRSLRGAQGSSSAPRERILLVLGVSGMAGFLGIHLAFAADVVAFPAYCVILSLSLGAYVSSLVAGRLCFEGARPRCAPALGRSDG